MKTEGPLVNFVWKITHEPPVFHKIMSNKNLLYSNPYIYTLSKLTNFGYLIHQSVCHSEQLYSTKTVTLKNESQTFSSVHGTKNYWWFDIYNLIWRTFDLYGKRLDR